MISKQWMIAGISVFALAMSGCGKKEVIKLPPTAPFSGTVKLDDQPLAGATVTFFPNTQKEHVANGATDANGKYELMTVGPEVVKGAVPGEYKVRISLSKTPDGKPVDLSKKGAMPGRETLKLEYSDLQKTRLAATVPEKGGTKDFELKSK